MNENLTETNNVEMTAGEMLRNARTTGRRKREIATVAKQLCIREEFLQALEDGAYNQIPETVYILGFARNYAMELGLNPDEIVTKIKREMGLVPECQASDSDKSDDATCALPTDRGAVGFFMRAWRFVVRKWMWFLGGLGVLVLIVAVLAAVLSATKSDVAASDAAPVPVATVVEPTYNVAVRERFGIENQADANVILQANQETWVKIEDARGGTVFSRVLVPGDVYYVPRGDKFKATVGNAGGLDVWVDGKQAPKIGENHVRKTGVSLAPASLMPASNNVAPATAE